jgi:DNA-binding transcriptional ArsR family regulator
LANRRRLQIFRLLLQRPGQTVSAVAQHLKLTLPVASQYLRALEARGLLTVHRTGGRVKYQIRDASSETAAQELIRALRRTFERDPHAVEKVFKLTTAFTHPRRIEIFDALRRRAQTAAQLRAQSRMSARAVVRHLGKLEARGFVACRLGLYSRSQPPDGFGRALASLAARSRKAAT